MGSPVNGIWEDGTEARMDVDCRSVGLIIILFLEDLGIIKADAIYFMRLT